MRGESGAGAINHVKYNPKSGVGGARKKEKGGGGGRRISFG